MDGLQVCTANGHLVLYWRSCDLTHRAGVERASIGLSMA